MLRAARDWQRTRYENGFGWISGPPEYGGRGLTPVHELVYDGIESEYDVPDTGTLSVIGLGMIGPTILAHGQQPVKDRYLPAMYRGDVIACQLFSEPEAGSDLASLQTRAVPVDGAWILDGQKVWTSVAQHSQIGMALCRTDPDAPKHKGITAFLVDMSAPGVEVRPLRQMSGGSDFNEVFLSGVRVPDDHRLGEVNGGWRVALTTLMNERATVGSEGSGPVAEALSPERLSALMRATWTWDDRALRRDLSELLADVMATGHLNARAFRRMQAGVAPGPEMSVAKLMYAQNLTRAAHFVSHRPRAADHRRHRGMGHLRLDRAAAGHAGAADPRRHRGDHEEHPGRAGSRAAEGAGHRHHLTLPRATQIWGHLMNEGKEELDELREAVREFLAAKSGESAVRAAMDTGYDPAVWDQMARQLRLPGLALPSEYGGDGFGLTELEVVLEEMGAALAVLALLRHGGARRPGAARLGRRGGLRPVPARDRRRADHRHAGRGGRQRVVGPGHGLGPGRAHPGGGWALSGKKSFVIDGAIADLVLVVARSTAGPGLFAVDRGAPGLRAEPMTTLDPTRPMAALTFDQVPAVLIGAEGRGGRLMSRVLDLACVALAAEQAGGARRCLEMSAGYARTRFQFGRPIGSFQAVKHKCADMLVRVELAEATAREAARLADEAAAEIPGRRRDGAHLLLAGLPVRRGREHPGARRHRVHLGAPRPPVLPPRQVLRAALRRPGRVPRAAARPAGHLTPSARGAPPAASAPSV